MFPFVPAAPVIFHIPGFFAANKGPLIHPDNQLTCPPPSFFFFVFICADVPAVVVAAVKEQEEE